MLLEERKGYEGLQFFIPHRGTFEPSRGLRGSLPQILCMAHFIGLECHPGQETEQFHNSSVISFEE